jgi:hypothetical protein
MEEDVLEEIPLPPPPPEINYLLLSSLKTSKYCQEY